MSGCDFFSRLICLSGLGSLNWILGKLTSAIANSIKGEIITLVERAVKNSLQGVINQHLPPTKEILWMKLLGSLDNQKGEQLLAVLLQDTQIGGAQDLNDILDHLEQGQGQEILEKISEIQGGSGLALLNDPEVLNFVSMIAADPNHQFDPSSLSEEKKVSICLALETLMKDNPTILQLLGVKETSVPFCDLRFDFPFLIYMTEQNPLQDTNLIIPQSSDRTTR